MALFDETQALEDDFDLDEESIPEIDAKKEVATLTVTNNDVFPTPFPIYTGQNIVGRHEKADVCIPIKALSKKHACIEVLGDQHFISDFGSKNRTRRGKLVLPPNVKYELTDGCILTFGNVTCTYDINDDGKTDDTDSLSDLYSDSMIPDDPNENLPHDIEDADISHDALQAQPTQPCVHTPVLFSSQIGEKRKYRENVEDEAVFVADSEPQDDDKKMDILQGNSFCLVKETPDYRFENTEKKPFIDQKASPPRMDASHLLLIRESDDDDSLCSEPIDIPGGNANQIATNNGNTSRSNSQDYAVMATQAYGVADRIDESTDIEDNDILKETLILDKTTDSSGQGSDDDDATDMEDDELEKGDDTSERDRSTAKAKDSVLSVPKMQSTKQDTKKPESSSSSTAKQDENSDDCYNDDTDIEDDTSDGGRSISKAAETDRSSVAEKPTVKGHADKHENTRSSRVMLTTENQNKMTDIELSLMNSKASHSEVDEVSANDGLTVKDTPEKESESDVPFDTMPVGTQQLEVNTLPGGIGRNSGGKQKGTRAFALDYDVDWNQPTQPYCNEKEATQTYAAGMEATQAYGSGMEATQAYGVGNEATEAQTFDINAPTQAYNDDGKENPELNSEEDNSVEPTSSRSELAATQAYSIDLNAPSDLKPYTGDFNAAAQANGSYFNAATQAYSGDFNAATQAYSDDFNAPTQPGDFDAATQAYNGDFNAATQAYSGDYSAPSQPYSGDLNAATQESTDASPFDEPTQAYKDDFDMATPAYNEETVLSRHDSNNFKDTSKPSSEQADSIQLQTYSSDTTQPYNEEKSSTRQELSSYGNEQILATQAYGKGNKTQGDNELDSSIHESSNCGIEATQAYYGDTVPVGELEREDFDEKACSSRAETTQGNNRSNLTRQDSNSDGFEATQAYYGDTVPLKGSAGDRVQDGTQSCSGNTAATLVYNEDADLVEAGSSRYGDEATQAYGKELQSVAVEPKSVTIDSKSDKVEPNSVTVEPKYVVVEPKSVAVEPKSAVVEPTSVTIETTSVDNNQANQDDARSETSSLTSKIADKSCNSNIEENLVSNTSSRAKRSTRTNTRNKGSISIEPLNTGDVEGLQEKELSLCQNDEPVTAKPTRGRRRKAVKGKSTENDSTPLENSLTESLESIPTNDINDQQSEVKPARGRRRRTTKDPNAENDLTLAKVQIDESSSTSLKNRPSDSMESLQINDINDEQSKAKSTARGRRRRTAKGQSAENDLTLAKGQIDENSSTSLQNSPSDSMESLQINEINDEQSKAKPVARGRRRRTTKDKTAENDLTLAEGQNTESKGQHIESTSIGRMRKSAKTNNAGDGSFESSRKQITLEKALSISASSGIGDIRANQDASHENDGDNVKTSTRGRRRKTKTDNDAEIVSTETSEQGMESQGTIPIEESRSDEKSHTNESPKNIEPASVRPTSRGRKRKNIKAEISSAESLVESESLKESKPIMESESINQASSSTEKSESAKQTKSRKKSNRITMPETNLDESSMESPGRKKRGRSSTFDSKQSDRSKRQCVRAKPKVLFTGLLDQTIETWKRQPWANFTDSVYDATHLVTDKIRRSVKFLCCLSRGINIVSPQWLESCRNAQKVIPDDEYTVDDKELEKKYDFKLKNSIALASETGLLSGFEVYVTKNVKPDPKQMKDIIQCAGGKAISKLSSVKNDKTLIITCEEDQNEVRKIADSAKSLYNAELLLTGILQQKLKLDSFRFDWDQGKTPAKRARKK